ncbi:MAG: chemotaxis protein CheW [Solirubrobacterales bacterium]
MLDMFIFETAQQVERLEQLLLLAEQAGGFNSFINEIFRIMHTLKGSAAMMLFDNLAALAHSVEDLFYYLREFNPNNLDNTTLADIVLEGVDFVKTEIAKIDAGDAVDGDANPLIDRVRAYLDLIKQAADHPEEPLKQKRQTEAETKQIYYIHPDQAAVPAGNDRFQALIWFDVGCEMENVRAFLVIHNLKEIATDIVHFPDDIMENDATAEVIREEGFRIQFRCDKPAEQVEHILLQTAFVREVVVEAAEHQSVEPPLIPEAPVKPRIVLDESEVELETIREAAQREQPEKEAAQPVARKQNLISVNVDKLDALMDLVGELIISEAMVTQNPELEGLNLDGFFKSARQLQKITHDLQDLVMSIRMVPLTMTFQKMNRLVRDMGKKTNKDLQLIILGAETEVDKNIIEHISDPLMHLVRNAIDHGLETPAERAAKGKPEKGTVVLEAVNEGGDVWINIRDDGRGMDRDKIMAKARDHGLLSKPESEYSDREVFGFVLLPGFSTRDMVTEYSGRGVGMDVAVQNIEKIGGSVIVDSKPDAGTTISLKIPITLGIIDGMNIKVGNTSFTVPMTTIRESFRVDESEIIADPDGNEMIMVRGQCHPVIRLYQYYRIDQAVTESQDGIIMMVDHNERTMCLFADALLGEQQVVIKPLPEYIKRVRKKVRGIAGCALLGDGSISLIMDVAGLMN